MNVSSLVSTPFMLRCLPAPPESRLAAGDHYLLPLQRIATAKTLPSAARSHPKGQRAKSKRQPTTKDGGRKTCLLSSVFRPPSLVVGPSRARGPPFPVAGRGRRLPCGCRRQAWRGWQRRELHRVLADSEAGGDR